MEDPRKNVTSVEGFEFLLDPSAQRLSFLLNQAYLASGFDAVTGASEALKVNICIPTRALARIMWHAKDAQTIVACPYIFVEDRNRPVTHLVSRTAGKIA